MFLSVLLAFVSSSELWLGRMIGLDKVRFGVGAPDRQLDLEFQDQNGWIGGDGAFSVPTSGRRSWWLFSDTWVGTIRGGARVDATIVNNTAGLLDGSKLTFIIRRAGDGKPTALVAPEDGRGWFWLASGIDVKERLSFFLWRIEPSGDGGAFGFRQTGVSLGVVENPSLDPGSWKAREVAIPFAQFAPEHATSFGFSTLAVGRWAYLYGTAEDRGSNRLDRSLILARCPVDAIDRFGSWRFWTKAGWGSTVGDSLKLARDVGSEGSVSYLPHLGLYVLVTTERGLSPRIMARTAKSPEGPWSEAVEVYRCPDGSGDKNVFCYAAKNHPELARGDELVISYCTNSLDFGQVARDARLYFPLFVRVPVAATAYQ